MRIGKSLADARRRAGLDLRAVEAQTKIRLKYISALEDEDWDALPSSAYAKGFLRTYAELLGLDAERLVDEYRRQVEDAVGGPRAPAGAPDRPTRAGAGSGRPSPWLLVGGGALLVLAVLVVAGLLSGGDKPGDANRPHKHGGGRGNHHSSNGHGGGKGGTVKLELVIRQPVEVCLVGGAGGALIDGQVLAADTREQFERRRFELRFPKGFDRDELRLKLAGEPARLPKGSGPASFEISPPAHLRPGPRPDEVCP